MQNTQALTSLKSRKYTKNGELINVHLKEKNKYKSIRSKL